MNLRAIEKATAALDAARDAYLALKNAETFPQSDRAWTNFVIHANRVYHYLCKGSKDYGSSEAWYGKIKHDRGKDPLLRYLHHARNADEHSLQNIKLPATLLNVSPITEASSPLTITVGYSIEGYLVPVIDRGDKYDVPEQHQGIPLADSCPLTVAQLALKYLDGIINDAKRYT